MKDKVKVGKECNKCGKCCYLRLVDFITGDVIETGIKCPHLTADNLCDTYENRPSWCLSGEEMKRLNLLPEGCTLR